MVSACKIGLWEVCSDRRQVCMRATVASYHLQRCKATHRWEPRTRKVLPVEEPGTTKVCWGVRMNAHLNSPDSSLPSL